MFSKVALITRITGQDGSYLAEWLLEKEFHQKPALMLLLNRVLISFPGFESCGDYQGDCIIKMIMSLAKIKLDQIFSQPSKSLLSPTSSSAKGPY